MVYIRKIVILIPLLKNEDEKMRLFKSFIVSFVVFIALNFIMNLLIHVAKGTTNLGLYFSTISNIPLLFMGSFFTITSIGIVPPGFGIFDGINVGISWFGTNTFLGIIIILASLLPALLASIIGGKMADTSIQAFIGFMLAMFLSSFVIVVFYLISSAQISTLLKFFNTSLPSVIIVYTLLFGIFNGIFWSPFAALMGREERIRD